MFFLQCSVMEHQVVLPCELQLSVVLTHSVQVLLFGVCDVTSDPVVESKHQLLRIRHGSHRLRALYSHSHMGQLWGWLPQSNAHTNTNLTYLPLAICSFELFVYVVTLSHQHHGIIRSMLQHTHTHNCYHTHTYTHPNHSTLKYLIE